MKNYKNVTLFFLTLVGSGLVLVACNQQGYANYVLERKAELLKVKECKVGQQVGSCVKALIEQNAIHDQEQIGDEASSQFLFDNKPSDDDRVYDGICQLEISHKDGKIIKYEVTIVHRIGERPDSAKK